MKIFGLIISAILLLALGCIFSGWIIMLIWNALASYFEFKTITFGIGVLISIALSVLGSFFKNYNSNKN